MNADIELAEANRRADGWADAYRKLEFEIYHDGLGLLNGGYRPGELGQAVKALREHADPELLKRIVRNLQ